MKATVLLLVAVCGGLAGCGDKDEDQALENFDRNPQEYYNTATDPAGPKELTAPDQIQAPD